MHPSQDGSAFDGGSMEEKSYEEFQRYLSCRNDWSVKCDLYSTEIHNLQEKIERLTRAGQSIASSDQDVRELMNHLQRLPETCSDWCGRWADTSFHKCTEGELYNAYDAYHLHLEEVLSSIEYTRNRLSIQLEETNRYYLEARSNYVCWANRAAYYWI